MAQIASPVAAAFPQAVEHLLQTSLELRDRYERSEISAPGMRTATGKLEAKLDRPFGAHLRYWGRHRERELACLLWTSPAWKMQARDAWIGWSDQQRGHNLQAIVKNGRFLILPWVQVKGLASKILALSARQMPRDWEIRYGCRPLLLETLVDAARFRGTCYRAANWMHVGQTVGRGRMDRNHTAHGQAVKDIYGYPLVRDARQRLCGDLTRQTNTSDVPLVLLVRLDGT